MSSDSNQKPRKSRSDLAFSQEGKEMDDWIKNLSESDEAAHDWEEAFSHLAQEYKTLLKKTKMVTKLGDRMQNKLRRLMEELEAKNERIEAQNQALEELNEKLVEASLSDPLTGLKNRRYLQQFMQVEKMALIRSCQAPDKPDSFMLFCLIDIDFFKRINDTYGHAVGDEVLIDISKILKEACRKSDIPIRWGGEEFLIAMREASPHYAPVFAEKIRSTVENHVFEISGGTVAATCSLGFAFYPCFSDQPELFSFEMAINLAEQCLYAAKRAGRNGWVGIFPRSPWPTDLNSGADVQEMLSKDAISIQTSFADDIQLNFDHT